MGELFVHACVYSPELFLFFFFLPFIFLVVCVCVCVRERERERGVGELIVEQDIFKFSTLLKQSERAMMVNKVMLSCDLIKDMSDYSWLSLYGDKVAIAMK